ncbi:hypothetical protein [Lysobacter gummosus]|uniref:hypothetical protein n=1 Tax=Lysobacter gummosus TaxID=262324 RepID=UPI0036388D9D
MDVLHHGLRLCGECGHGEDRRGHRLGYPFHVFGLRSIHWHSAAGCWVCRRRPCRASSRSACTHHIVERAVLSA